MIGLCAAALRQEPPRPRAVAAGVLGGVLVGDGVYGLTVVASSTSPVAWSLVLACGVVGAVLVARRLPTWGDRVLVAAVLAVVAVAFRVGYAVVG